MGGCRESTMRLEAATNRVNSVWVWHLWHHFFGLLGEAVTTDGEGDHQVNSEAHLQSQH